MLERQSLKHGTGQRSESETATLLTGIATRHFAGVVVYPTASGVVDARDLDRRLVTFYTASDN